jgi:hypothetical protein
MIGDTVGRIPANELRAGSNCALSTTIRVASVNHALQQDATHDVGSDDDDESDCEVDNTLASHTAFLTSMRTRRAGQRHIMAPEWQRSARMRGAGWYGTRLSASL